MATLMAIGYPAEETAARAVDDLDRGAADLGIDPESIAVVRRDREGSIRVTTNHHATSDGSSWGMFWGFLFSSLFFVPVFGMSVGAGLGPVVGRIESSGLDETWRDRARDMVQPGTSAAFLIVDPARADAVLQAVSSLGGTVLTCALPEQAARDLQQQLHGDSLVAWSRP